MSAKLLTTPALSLRGIIFLDIVTPWRSTEILIENIFCSNCFFIENHKYLENKRLGEEEKREMKAVDKY